MNNPGPKKPRLSIVTDAKGRRYAYEIVSHRWDAEKGYGVTTKKYYGTVDEKGNVIPKKSRRVAIPTGEEDAGVLITSQRRVGMTGVLEHVARDTGLEETLRSAFPGTWRAVLSLASYHACSGSNRAYLFEQWAQDHPTALEGARMTGQDISRLYARMDEDGRQRFLRAWREKSSTGDLAFHDIASISSYSRLNDAVAWGYNRDKEDLPQVNLAMTVDARSRLPVCYGIHDGDVADVSTLRHVLRKWHLMDMKRLTFVLDKGFYSTANISAMYGYRYHFIVAMSNASQATRRAIDSVRQSVRSPRNLITTAGGDALYALSVESHWDAEGARRPCVIHVYSRSTEEDARRSIAFDMKLRQCHEELNGGTFIPVHAHLYGKYFIQTVHEDGGTGYDYDDAKIARSDGRYAGYLCIVTDRMDYTAAEVMDIYRSKDGVEKVFDDVKNANDCRRLHVGSRPAFEGKMFVLFLCSILTSEMRTRLGRMKDVSWTLEMVRRELEKIVVDTISPKSCGTARTAHSILSRTQRRYLSALLMVPEKDVETALFSHP